jgi:hypothetical protein
MGSFANYWEDKILNHIFGKGNYTPPSIYVGLSTASPADDAAGLAEPSGQGYARAETAADDWNTAAGGSLDNASDIAFPQAAGGWGTVTHFALFDAATAGNMLAHGALSQAKTLNSGDTVKFTAGDIHITLD